MMQPLTIPAAWRGDELLKRPDWRLELTAEHLAEIDEALLPAQPSAESADQCRANPFARPRLTQFWKQVQHDLEHQAGACLITGLPLERFDEQQSRQLFFGIASSVGTPVSQSATGERIFSVRDEGWEAGHAQARGPNTRKRLSFHTDRCDVIAFLCLQQAKSGGENQLVSSVTLYNELLHRRPDLLEVLMQPFYYRRHNVDTGNDQPWCQQPIFSFHEGHFAASFLRVLIERAYAMPELPDMTAAQREALDYLEQLAGEPELHVTFRLEPGDLLFLNNWVTFHRRNEFADYADDRLRRHLLRIWLAVPNSRPLHPLFADNYGATAAGAVRGGMRTELEV